MSVALILFVYRDRTIETNSMSNQNLFWRFQALRLSFNDLFLGFIVAFIRFGIFAIIISFFSFYKLNLKFNWKFSNQYHVFARSEIVDVEKGQYTMSSNIMANGNRICISYLIILLKWCVIATLYILLVFADNHIMTEPQLCKCS